MITENYVSSEVAKLLKEKGFNEATSHVYSDTKELLRLTDYCIKDLTNKDCDEYMNWQFPIEEVTDIISAPTLQSVMKWLREVHKLYVVVRHYVTQDGFFSLFDVKLVKEKGIVVNLITKTGFTTYEEACEAGIRYTLENLI